MCNIHQKLCSCNLQEDRKVILNIPMHQSSKLFNQDHFSFGNSQLHVHYGFGFEAPRNEDSINQWPIMSAEKKDTDFTFSFLICLNKHLGNAEIIIKSLLR